MHQAVQQRESKEGANVGRCGKKKATVRGEIIRSVHEYSYTALLGKGKGEKQSRLVVNEGMAPRSETHNRFLLHLQTGGANLTEIFSEQTNMESLFYSAHGLCIPELGGKRPFLCPTVLQLISHLILTRLSIPQFYNIPLRNATLTPVLCVLIQASSCALCLLLNAVFEMDITCTDIQKH